MPRRLRPTELDFVTSAPLRLVFAARLSTDPETVHRALAEDVEGWARWFSAVALARPTDGGKGREVRLRGGARFLETIVASAAPTRYAYRVDETNVPGLRALLEEWLLTPEGTGTRLQWTFAMDASAPVRLATRLARPALARAFRDAAGALDRRLSG